MNHRASNPQSAAREALRLMREGRLDEALVFAERAVENLPCCHPSHGMLAAILLRLGRTQDADAVISYAMELEQGGADAYDGLAYVSMGLGSHERASVLYRRAVHVSPGDPRFLYNLACCERSLGRLAEAEEACDRAIAVDATAYPTYLLRSELRVQAPDANHITELEALLAGPDLEDRARMFLGYALAKEFDDVGRFDEAFQWFSLAARTRRSRLSYDIASDEHKLRRIEETFPRNMLGINSKAESSAGRSLDSSRFIFIVGLPRSGTTLMERILTGLHGVRSNGETEYFSRALLTASRGDGDVFQRAAAADPAVVASEYAQLAKVGTDKGLIEKLPMNYLYVGAICRALPGARILLVSRSPLDSCFAMYRTLFGDAYPFSYNLEELGRYYAAYERLMNHWRATLGARLHEIIYEDLVHEPQRVGASAAKYCGLSWTDAAVDIQNNRSVSLTASAAQVRRPIYGSSSGRWRHYQRHLDVLIETLRRHGVTLPM